ncbi:hypothetical protein ACVWZ6_004499 [Bradyrhizobium sp. GM6.1]
MAAPSTQRRDDRHGDRPILSDPKHADERRREPAHRSDRQIDLADHQDTDDAQRDHTHCRAIEKQIDQIVRREKNRVESLERRADDDEPDDHRQRSEITRPHTVHKGADHVSKRVRVLDSFVTAVEQPRRRNLLRVFGHRPSSGD